MLFPLRFQDVADQACDLGGAFGDLDAAIYAVEVSRGRSGQDRAANGDGDAGTC